MNDEYAPTPGNCLRITLLLIGFTVLGSIGLCLLTGVGIYIIAAVFD